MPSLARTVSHHHQGQYIYVYNFRQKTLPETKKICFPRLLFAKVTPDLFFVVDIWTYLKQLYRFIDNLLDKWIYLKTKTYI